MISYAQNFEDVMLWRALKNIKRGFYIDIGAQDPIIDSVSLCFYNAGWIGVHVEPIAAYAQALRDARPEETVVQAAVGEGVELISFFEISGTGISTGDTAIARRHEAAGFSAKQIDVACIRLSSLLEKYRDRDIHWLKIDVEGMELSVLQSWGTATNRPWIIVLESTLPLSQEQSHSTWEPLVLGLGYIFVYFDGLNRFYVSRDHEELLPAFKVPPNIFDNFVLAASASHPFCDDLKNSLSNATQEIVELTNQKTQLDAQLALLTPTREQAIHVQKLEQNLIERTAQLKEAEHEVVDLLNKNSVLNDRHIARVVFLHNESNKTKDALLEREIALSKARFELQSHKAEVIKLEADVTILRSAAEELQRQKVFDESSRCQLATLLEEKDLALTRLWANQQSQNITLQQTIKQMRADIESTRDEMIALMEIQAKLKQPFASRQLWIFRHLRIFIETLIGRWQALVPRIKPNPTNISTDNVRPAASSCRELEENKMSGYDLASDRDTYKRMQELIKSILCAETEVFLQKTYWLLLGRACDDSGRNHFLEEAYRGVSKLEIMNRIALSEEGGGRSKYRPMISRAARMERLAAFPLGRVVVQILGNQSFWRYPSTAESLLQLHGQEFVEQAYKHILRRGPDSDGLANSLAAVRAGVPKIEIIRGMMKSQEYKYKTFSNIDFRRLARRQQFSKLPLVGRLMSILLDLESCSMRNNQLRSIEEIQHLLLNKIISQEKQLAVFQRKMSVADYKIDPAESEKKNTGRYSSSIDLKSSRQSEETLLSLKRFMSTH